MDARIEAHSPEWYKARQGLFTASRLHELLTKPKDKDLPRPYVIEKVAEVLTGESQDSDYLSEDMAHGVEYEPLAIKWYSKLTGHRVEENSEFIKHPELRFGATPDRIAYDKDGNKIVLEVKCPKSKTHVKYCLFEDVEMFKAKMPKYFFQLVGGAICHGATKAAFVSFDPRIDSACGMFILQFDIPQEDIDLATKAIQKAEEELTAIVEQITNTEAE